MENWLYPNHPTVRQIELPSNVCAKAPPLRLPCTRTVVFSSRSGRFSIYFRGTEYEDAFTSVSVRDNLLWTMENSIFLFVRSLLHFQLRAQVEEGEKLVSKYKRDLEALSSENGRLDGERIEAVSELERKKEGLKEAMMIMDGLREEIAACLTENSYRLPTKFGKAGKEADMNLKLSNVIEVIEAYGSQFEQLEMRLAIEDKRQRQRQPISEVDVTETISDLRYRVGCRFLRSP